MNASCPSNDGTVCGGSFHRVRAFPLRRCAVLRTSAFLCLFFRRCLENLRILVPVLQTLS
eukprot:6180076-Pleurochrysis_carterae.AAC.3